MCSLNDNSVLRAFSVTLVQANAYSKSNMVFASHQIEGIFCYAELIMIIVNMMVLVLY